MSYQLLSLFQFPQPSILHSNLGLNQDLAELDFLRFQDSISFLAAASILLQVKLYESNLCLDLRYHCHFEASYYDQVYLTLQELE